MSKKKQEEISWQQSREIIIEDLLSCRTEREFNNLLMALVDMLTENEND